MKRLFAILLVVITLFSFTGCSFVGNIRGEQSVNNGSLSDKDKFDLGTIDGLKYENTFVGIGCYLPEDWTFYTDEQIMELNNYLDGVTTEDYKELLEEAQIVYDMCAISSNQMDNINVNMEKVGVLASATFDIAENFEQSIPLIAENFEAMGYTNLKCEISTTEIDGEEFVCLNTTGMINDVPMYQRSISIKCYGYIANVAITTYYENEVDTLLDGFYLTD